MYIPLIINVDIVKNLERNSFYFSYGLEFMSQRPITLRLGLSSKRKTYLTDDFSYDLTAGVSCGVGIRFQKTILDIGFMNLGPAGYIIGFSINNNRY